MEKDTRFQTIREAAKSTGLSQYFLRTGCKNGSIPFILCGNVYRINMPLLLKQLDEQSTERGDVN